MVVLVVDRQKMIANYNIVREQAGVPVIPVMKGNAYGLGIVEAGQFLAGLDIEMIAVARLEEASYLRDVLPHIKILMLGACVSAEDAAAIVDMELIASIESIDGAKVLDEVAARENKQIEVHLQFDTGMGRFGFLPDQYPDIAKLKDLSHIRVCGCYSHLANCFGPNSQSVEQQLVKFTQGVEAVKSFGIDPGMRHLANSVGALLYPQIRLDAVRSGSALVGRTHVAAEFGLKEVAHLEAQVKDIRILPCGHSLGYGSIWQMKRDTRIAIIEAGYTDGLLLQRAHDTFRWRDIARHIINDGKDIRGGSRPTCHINGQKAFLIGGGGLSNVFADITDIDCQVGDKAVFSVNPTFIDSRVAKKYI